MAIAIFRLLPSFLEISTSFVMSNDLSSSFAFSVLDVSWCWLVPLGILRFQELLMRAEG
jgi:hypothetical protein